MRKAKCVGMARNERRLIEINETISLSQMLGDRKDGTEQFTVCIKTDTGELAAIEMIVRNPNGVFSFKDTNIGTIESA